MLYVLSHVHKVSLRSVGLFSLKTYILISIKRNTDVYTRQLAQHQALISCSTAATDFSVIVSSFTVLHHIAPKSYFTVWDI